MHFTIIIKIYSLVIIKLKLHKYILNTAYLVLYVSVFLHSQLMWSSKVCNTPCVLQNQRWLVWTIGTVQHSVFGRQGSTSLEKP